MALREATGAFPDLLARCPTRAAHDRGVRGFARIVRSSPGAGHDKLHDLTVTQDYCDALPAMVRDHLVCSVVDCLIPVTQKHNIEGLVTGCALARAAASSGIAPRDADGAAASAMSRSRE
jgi:hypothetical protein